MQAECRGKQSPESGGLEIKLSLMLKVFKVIDNQCDWGWGGEVVLEKKQNINLEYILRHACVCVCV